MNVYGPVFYFLAAMILVSTLLAVTRRNPVHAVIYLVMSFMGTAMLFYLLGAPFLAAFEVIIYAGAIMVLFLFVVMMLRAEESAEAGPRRSRWIPSAVMAGVFAAVLIRVVLSDPGGRAGLLAAVVTPGEFGRFVFQNYWLAVEAVSFLLLVALVAAVQFRREEGASADREASGV